MITVAPTLNGGYIELIPSPLPLHALLRPQEETWLLDSDHHALVERKPDMTAKIMILLLST